MTVINSMNFNTMNNSNVITVPVMPSNFMGSVWAQPSMMPMNSGFNFNFSQFNFNMPQFDLGNILSGLLNAYTKNNVQINTVQTNNVETNNVQTNTNVPAMYFGALTISNKQPNNNFKVNMTSQKAQNAVQLAELEYRKGVRELTGRDDGPEIDKYRKGAKSGAWCASFASWLYGDGQNSKNKETFGYTASVSNMKTKAERQGFYSSRATGYVPQVGDVAVYMKEDNHLRNGKIGPSNHVGIVVAVSEDGKNVTIIDGNSGNKVNKKVYNDNNNKFTGYIRMNEWHVAQEKSNSRAV